jgi:hypothetical protein
MIHYRKENSCEGGFIAGWITALEEDSLQDRESCGGGLTVGKRIVEEDLRQDREQLWRRIHCRTENSCGGGFTAGQRTVVKEYSLQDREQLWRRIHCRTENSCGGGCTAGKKIVVEEDSLQDRECCKGGFIAGQGAVTVEVHCSTVNSCGEDSLQDSTQNSFLVGVHVSRES